MSPTTFSNIVKGVFLLSYAAFLAASINHVAYFFHSFEPAMSNWWDSLGPYALAGSIDVTSLLLTIGVTYQRQGVSGFALAVVWCFIFLLTGFSWIANWEYAQQFQSRGLSMAASQHVLFFNFTFKDLNPILASSFAFLNLAYSVVADFFNAKPRTAEQIREEAEKLKATAAALKEKREAQAQMQAANNEGAKRWIKGKLGIIQEVLPRNKPSESRLLPAEKQVNPLQDETQKADSDRPVPTILLDKSTRQTEGDMLPPETTKPAERSEQNTDVEKAKADGKAGETREPNLPLSGPDTGVLSLLNHYPKINDWLAAGRRTATIEEIADATNHGKRKVANHVRNGTLKRSPRNAHLILISSVVEWLKTVSPPQQNGAIQREQLAMPLVENAG